MIKDFESFWGQEVLYLTHGTITKSNNCNWLVEVSWDRKMTEEPIRHILLGRFLGLTMEQLFNKPIRYMPFGEPPFPCLNPVCPEYKKNVIKEVIIKNNYKEKSPVGYFTCPICQFSYIRKGPDKKQDDRYRYSRIADYGYYWREKLESLLKMYSVPKVAKMMGTTHTTIYNYIKRTAQKNG